MRDQEVVFDLIKTFALESGVIRGIILTGSRVNKNVDADMFQDYDIIYIVTNTLYFRENLSWLKRFGELALHQEPDKSSIIKSNKNFEDHYTVLAQFQDGVRIDFNFKSLPYALRTIYDDKLSKVILDKDGIIPKLEEASDKDYILKRPTAREFKDCCNEFWWISTYVVKGLARNEVLYAMDHLNLYLRPMLQLMYAYKVGHLNNYSLNFGKNYKYLPKYMLEEDYKNLEATYTLLDLEYIWDALILTTKIFKDLSIEVAKMLFYDVNLQEIENAIELIKKIKNNGGRK